jgi:small redox-active disulfide protein 2
MEYFLLGGQSADFRCVGRDVPDDERAATGAEASQITLLLPALFFMRHKYKERRRTKMLNIKILGSGCANCKRLEQITRMVVGNLGMEAEIEKVTDFTEIMKYPIISTPGLVINEKVVSSGRIPTETQITDWLIEA